MSFNKILKVGKSLFLALLLAMCFRSLLYEPFHIPSGSMKSTLMVGDYVFVSKYSYGFSRYSFPFAIPLVGKTGRVLYTEPKRGDVVVFRKPNETSVNYVKRLIGLPGDKIQLKDGIVYINGEKVKREKLADFLDIDYNGKGVKVPQYIETLDNGFQYTTLDQIEQNIQADNTQVYVVPDDHFFVLGDNRDNSVDSRFMYEVGFIPKDNLVGKAQIVIFSVSRNKGILPFKFDIERFFKKVQ